MRPGRRYPLAPLLALTGWSYSDIQKGYAACNATEWRIRKERGVTEVIADRLATAAGLHPHNVWPDFGHVACEADDCDELFLPTDPRRRFCSRRCVSRRWQRDRYRRDAEFREAEKAARRQRYAECADYERARQARYRARQQAGAA